MLAFIATMFSLIPKRLVFAAVGALAGAAVLWGTFIYGKHEGRQQAAVEAAQATAKALKDRNHENATVGAADAVHICLDLGASLHDCRAGLRGMGKDQSQTPVGGVSGKP